MKSLRIEKNKYGLKIYCTECRGLFSEKNIHKCNHPERQKYKSVVFYDGKRVKTKFHDTQDFDEALLLAIRFKKEVKEMKVIPIHKKPQLPKSDSLTILESANIYMNFKNGIDVPSHMKRDISKKHLDSIENNIRLFITVLREKGIEPRNLLFTELDDYHVGYFADYLKLNYKEGSWNLRVSILKSWVEYTIKKHRLVMFNPFEGFKRIKFEKNIESITEKEFKAVLHAVDTMNPIEHLGGSVKTKNRYRPYLKDAFTLALYTGLRREEYLTLSWNNVIRSEIDDCYVIKTDNLKVERITGKKCPPKFIPVHQKLSTFLESLGWNENMDSDTYIINPNRKAQLNTMMVACTKAFSHFYRQAFPNQKYKPLGCLRKTYLSLLYREVDANMTKLSSHGSMKTLETHYLDKSLIVKGVKMEMFDVNDKLM